MDKRVWILLVGLALMLSPGCISAERLALNALKLDLLLAPLGFAIGVLDGLFGLF